MWKWWWVLLGEEVKYFLQLKHQIKAHFFLIHIHRHYTQVCFMLTLKWHKTKEEPKFWWLKADCLAEIPAFHGLMSNDEIMFAYLESSSYCIYSSFLLLLSGFQEKKPSFLYQRTKRNCRCIINVITAFVFSSLSELYIWIH